MSMAELVAHVFWLLAAQCSAATVPLHVGLTEKMITCEGVKLIRYTIILLFHILPFYRLLYYYSKYTADCGGGRPECDGIQLHIQDVVLLLYHTWAL